MRFLPVNLSSLLVELDDLQQTLGLFNSLSDEPIEGVESIIPAARTLLVQFRRSAVSTGELISKLKTRKPTHRTRQSELVEIPVHYNGEDLDEVAQLLSIDREELIRRHSEGEYQVAFCGFAPGFAYLSGGCFDVPRKSTPRTRIPAGAVGLAGAFSGIYPHDSPGGWQIIGVTPLKMWDLQREPAALLQPGQRVRFRRIENLADQVPHSNDHDSWQHPITVEGNKNSLHVLSPGLQSLFQDLGRTRQTQQGVSASGALDQGSLRAANRIVGNAPSSPCIEVALGGLKLRCSGRALVAVTGAMITLEVMTADGKKMQHYPYQPILLEDGDQLALGNPTAGIRSYLAVRGGFVVEAVLDSCATDTLARIGPPALKAGDELVIKEAVGGTAISLSEEPAFSLPSSGTTVTLDIIMGPRSDWFTPKAIERLCTQLWRVSTQSDRIGIRLQGEQPLQRSNPAELPSEGTVSGAIQVPSNGQPVLFLADHPLTGGYPVIACIAEYHLDLAGQIPPNAQIRFNPITAFHELDEHIAHQPSTEILP